MKRICLGCGMVFEGKEDALCPRSVNKGQSCGCLSEALEEETKPAEKARGDLHGSN